MKKLILILSLLLVSCGGTLKIEIPESTGKYQQNELTIEFKTMLEYAMNDFEDWVKDGDFIDSQWQMDYSKWIDGEIQSVVKKVELTFLTYNLNRNILQLYYLIEWEITVTSYYQSRERQITREDKNFYWHDYFLTQDDNGNYNYERGVY